MKILYAIFISIVLAACSPTNTPTDPAQAVYSLRSTYAAALTVAVAYKSLTPCVSGGTILCSKADVVAQIQKADDLAYPALLAAENTVRTPGAGANAATAVIAAQQAVNALTSITATLTVK